jgi:Mn2+/Fe2+ NRAMP family transporter
VLKWLTLILFAYFGTVLMVKIPWNEALRGLLIPTLRADKDFISTLVAVLGATISPYLFFWQASQEAEDLRVKPHRDRLAIAPEQAPAAFERIRLDTFVGMGLSNIVAMAVILTTAATLHANGTTDIATSQQAAEALYTGPRCRCTQLAACLALPPPCSRIWCRAAFPNFSQTLNTSVDGVREGGVGQGAAISTADPRLSSDFS